MAQNAEIINRYMTYKIEVLDAAFCYEGKLINKTHEIQLQFTFPASLYLADLGAKNYQVIFCIKKSFFEKYFVKYTDRDEDEAIKNFFFQNRNLDLCFAIHTNLICLISSNTKNFQKKLFVESYLMFMLYQLTVLKECNNQENNCAKYCNNQSRQRIAAVKNWLSSNFGSTVNLYDVSRNFGIHNDNLNYLFEKYHHQNIYHYVLAIRMQKACEMMQNSLYSFEEIAEKTGYSSKITLLKVYKDYYKHQPTLVMRN